MSNKKEKNIKKIFIVTGESSGDLHGGSLVREIRELFPFVEINAMGGANLRQAGANVVQDIEGLGVVGAVEVIRHLPKFRAVFDSLVNFMRQNPPDILVLIDYPGFNLRFAEKINKILPDTEIVYYITPQVWAWHRSRLKQMKRLLDLALVIFDFEEPLFRNAGIDAFFVGHPLIDVYDRIKIDGGSLRKKLNIGNDEKLVGLLPGSRKREIERLLPVMLGAAKVLSVKKPGLKFAVSCADKSLEDSVRSIMASAGTDYPVIKDRFRDLLDASDVVAVASGTATLECAIQKKPMVVLYKMAPFSYLLARLLVKIEHISLVNIIAKEGVVAELIQGAANPARLAKELALILDDETARNEMVKKLDKVRGTLGGPGASKRAAEYILELLQ